jgi:hypothetical protein
MTNWQQRAHALAEQYDLQFSTSPWKDMRSVGKRMEI